MSSHYLLDTSILILALNNDPVIRERLVTTDRAFISAVTLGELYHGAESSLYINKNKIQIDEIAQGATIFTVDQSTALTDGRLKSIQMLKGRMLPDNDLWIAATSLQHGLTLVARDNHFTWIDKLSLEQW